MAQADVDEGARPGVSSADLEEIRRLKAEDKKVTEANAILRAASDLLRGRARLPEPLIVGFIDAMRSEGFAVESAC